ncbi:pyridoxine 5'-phosphate synthase [Hyphomicrobium sp. ghe19]|uniref:pyridoxine 5'-phosphate synthase n=1 Tax=Hyphomicrobium sp. ghe19 TaxID=2682968 RepID=UPI001366A987|nr:Pyridoxine 5'-phosphate synthase [Hyphomicrobium sp. ghe19]
MAANRKLPETGQSKTTPARALRLGVNIDHVATLRNARGGVHPDPLRAAHLAIEGSADGITAHLREDRRHISDSDITRLKNELTRPLNLEMAATDEMLEIALRHVPNACCLVPERREERTTEGGLDVKGSAKSLEPLIAKLKDAGIRVSLFIEPDLKTIEAASAVGADIVELHTGKYCHLALDHDAAGVARELERHKKAAQAAASAGLEVHAGHGLTYNTVQPIARIPEIVELNIGHFLIGEAIFGGLSMAVRRMRVLMDEAREALSLRGAG